MLRIVSTLCVVLVFLAGFLYHKNSRKEAEIAVLNKTISEQAAELEYRNTLTQIKEDIDGLLKDYRSLSKQNQKELFKQQEFLTTLGQQVRDDVSDFANNPITSNHTVDISWVHAYNRSTVRIPYTQ